MKKILYLNCLELTQGNNIHKNQVLPLYDRFQGLHFKILFLSPLFILSRKKIGLNRNRADFRYSEIKLPLASYNHYLNWFILPIYIITSLIALFVFCKKNKYIPDVIHCRGYPSSLTACLFKSFFSSTRVIFDPRSVYAEEGVIIGRWGRKSPSFFLWKKAEHFICRRSSKIFALSSGMASYFSKYYDKVAVFPAVVDNQIFSFSEKKRASVRKAQREVPESSIILMYIGSIGLWHSSEDLLNIVDQIAKSNPSRSFFLYVLSGNMIDRDAYSSIPNLEGVVYKEVLNSEISDYLSIADIGILPATAKDTLEFDTLYSTMISSKLQEYLCMGLNLCVSKRISEVVTILREERIGFLYENFSAVVEVIGQELILSNERRKVLSQKYGEIFSLNRISKGYKNAYINE